MTDRDVPSPEPDDFGMIPPKQERAEASDAAPVEPVEDTQKLEPKPILPEERERSDLRIPREEVQSEEPLPEDIVIFRVRDENTFAPLRGGTLSSDERKYMERNSERMEERHKLMREKLQAIGFAGLILSAHVKLSEPEPVEKPDPYPSRAGWRADYLPPYDPQVEEAKDKPKGKIGEYDIIESATTFDDIGGNTRAKDLLLEIGEQFKEPDLYAQWDVPVPKGILLHGRPGTGKTMLAKAFANAAKAAFVEVPVASLRDRYYGQSEKKLKQLFDDAAKHEGQVIIFFDEIDALLLDRSDLHPESPNAQLVNTFLQAMDGMNSAKNVMVLGATNYPDRLDEAATRPGRFDNKVEVEMPDQAGCRDIAARRLLTAERSAKRVLVEDELDLNEIGKYLDGLSGADIAEVINRVKRTMVQTERALGKGVAIDKMKVDFKADEVAALKITTDDVVAAAINYQIRG